MRSGPVFASVLCVVLTTSANAGEAGYAAQPALHGNRAVFVSEGDLWSVDLTNASSDAALLAHRLTSSNGDESRPCISPDGKMLAFSAQYDGNTDVYVMPVDGGSPTRLTFHPSPDLVAGWLPDGGSVLFTSPRSHQFGRQELWRVGVSGGTETRYEFGDCSMVSLSATGRRFAFTRWSNENWTWKRYRGGTAPDIWLGDMSAGQFQPLTSNAANDLFPMWIGERVFFLSDREGTANIFSDSPSNPGKEVKQHTKFVSNAGDPIDINGYDIRWPAADKARNGSRIIFCQAGQLALLDTTNDQVTRLNVELASDRVAARQRFADLGETITEFSLSPDGKTLLVGSRGELMAMPVKDGPAVQLTRSSQAREWGASFFGDGQITLITDQSGEQQIAIMPADGSAAPGLLTEDREVWLFPTVTSPNGKLVAFADKTLRLHVLDTTTLEKKQIDQAEGGEITDYRFSPDSQWIAYTKPMANDMDNVFIASVRTGRTFSVSSNLQEDFEPRWDPAGKYLYFLSRRNINPVMSDFDTEHAFINTMEVYAVPLANDVPPPLRDAAHAAGFDLEKWAEKDAGKDNKKGAKTERKGDEEAKEGEEAVDAPPPVAVDPNAPPADAMRVDTDGLASRQFKLPIEPGRYGNLEAIWGGIMYVSAEVEGLMDDTWPAEPTPSGVIHRFDLVKGEGKPIAERVNEFAISQDAGTIAYPTLNDEMKVGGFTVMETSGGGGGGGEAKQVALDGKQLRINARAEWSQMFAEAWRLQRDFYWAPNFGGVDWPAMRKRYEALLPRIGTRQELNDVMGQLIGELGTSHTYIFGGQPFVQPTAVNVGLLGADIQFDGAGYKIARIIPGQNWGDPMLVSPLEASHLKVKEGNYLRAINGISLTPPMNPYDLLQDSVGKMVRLAIADDANGINTRSVSVKTLPTEQPLRYAAWVEANRRYVEEKSGGTIGYLHIPDMGGPGLVMFSRFFYPQFNKTAIIIDERDNGGGFVSQMIIGRLARKLLAFDQPRHGVTARYPTRALNAHLAMLIDQHAGSDGDIFPTAFKALGLGPLIGMRTWGGVVGIRGDKPFVDMGLSTQPEFAWWEAEGGWTVENQGVSPDIEIDNTPNDLAAGRDPQLDKALEYLLGKLKEDPKAIPAVPAWPVRVK